MGSSPNRLCFGKVGVIGSDDKLYKDFSRIVLESTARERDSRVDERVAM